ncbi:MAG: 3-hydroxyacyl-CoA dehydrogenase [Xanthobacteraceae bacterium]|nr:MAG: 3-hydroxyacyl-CoA dehydrogenase [Xanthobacteraceae bacterium]
MAFTNFRLETDADGIALVTWDMAGRSMNVFDARTIEELSAIVERTTADAAVKGVVITSAKDAFSGGADLTMLETFGVVVADVMKREGAEAASRKLLDEVSRLSRLFRRIETCGKPWVAAINGLALGGAFELSLSCHQRIAADNPKTRLGLPEIKVGLFPGAGGTQRLVRMLPPADALMMMLKGELLNVAKARAAKLVDAVVPPGELIAAAKDWIRSGGKAVAPWDVEGFKLPAGPVYSKAGMQMFPAANAIYRRETYDNYPAARAIMQCVYEGLQLPMDQALRVEARYFAHVVRTPEAAAMIRSLFLSMQDLNKGARRPKNVPPTRVRKVGIIGAGFMGASIGYVTARAGIDVVLIDRDQQSADKGKAHSDALISGEIKKGRAREGAREALLSRITATPDFTALKDCDLIVEAVFEDRKVKAETYAKAQPMLAASAIFASNTSTLPITSLATEFKDQGRFIGIHFFSPVDKMMLVEIILGKNTGEVALATALDYVRAIGKTPIVVNDSRGFFANRCVLNFVAEGHLMFGEGVPPAMIENVARMAGMPVGPLSLTDEIAIDLALRIVKATESDLGAAAIDAGQKALLIEMVETRGRLGRKNGKGFYDYPEKGKKKLWPGLAGLQANKLDPDTLDVEEMKQRFLVVQAVEAARTVEDGVIVDPREADVGSILGFGFAPFTGGTLSYIDMMGTKRFVELCQRLEKKYGPRFAPPRLLLDMAAKGETFYGRFAPAKSAA